MIEGNEENAEGLDQNPPVDAPPLETSADESAPADVPEELSADANIETGTEEYKPTHKFKVKDEEHEFDDWAKELAKTKEVEENLKKLYSKGFGIEGIQAKRDEYKTQLETVQTEHNQIKDSLSKLSGFVQNGDIGSFLEATGINKETIFDWVAKEIQYQQLPADQKAQIDQQRQMQQQQMMLTEQNQMMQQQLQQQVVAQKATELNMVLSDPKVSQIAKQFDARMGREGAFKEEVCKRGHYHFTANNQDIGAKQAVDEVIQLIGTTVTGQNSATGAAPQVPQNKKPVLPHISAGSTSPIAKQVSSIDDLKQKREQLLAGG